MVTVGQAAVNDVKLAVGSSSQLVEVQTDPPLVETERTQQSNTIDEQAVRNLPINRRDYLSFSLLAPGVTDSKAMADSNSFRVKQTPDSGLSFYGSNGRGNNISVDGGESNDDGGGVRPTVSQEAVQEFQINRTDYSAEHGQARGVQNDSHPSKARPRDFAVFIQVCRPRYASMQSQPVKPV